MPQSVPNPDSGDLEVYRTGTGGPIPNTSGKEHANPTDGLDLGTSDHDPNTR